MALLYMEKGFRRFIYFWGVTASHLVVYLYKFVAPVLFGLCVIPTILDLNTIIDI